MDTSLTETRADLWSVLQQSPGAWRGKGINHENERFDAVLVARRLFGSGGLLMWFRATGEDSTVYHEEVALLGPEGGGGLVMTAANTNIPFVQRFEGPAPGATTLAVHHGDHSVDSGFRETIRLSIDKAGTLTVAFDWAMPGEAMAERSAVRLTYSGDAPPSEVPIF
ncbi:hypothetical protein CKO44_05935 [Rubrivivax gelatinosus]|uniref:hypothetical protein n=1 Tax=Rubrivivax gelatinosus TaxID=28068 RepID=UPI0019050476|nr:hypothetical protein [Rubrivivax gelatinosus]MBK1613012.1 hypothetical protein [Rubrivivax gelatinosus]MBZ8143536.1 hypothetical protein [Rubrivivax gelatinosus]